jgi:hypothetical protein
VFAKSQRWPLRIPARFLHVHIGFLTISRRFRQIVLRVSLGLPFGIPGSSFIFLVDFLGVPKVFLRISFGIPWTSLRIPWASPHTICHALSWRRNPMPNFGPAEPLGSLPSDQRPFALKIGVKKRSKPNSMKTQAKVSISFSKRFPCIGVQFQSEPFLAGVLHF